MDEHDSRSGPAATALDMELSDGDLEAVVGGLSRVFLPGLAVQRPIPAAPAVDPA